MAESVHVIAVETASGQEAKHGDEAAQLRLERRFLAGSHYRHNGLVAAGPGGWAALREIVEALA